MIYIQRSDNVYVKFEGMTEDQITNMLQDQSLTCSFLSKEDYDIAVLTLQ